jgi:hypothetical protein
MFFIAISADKIMWPEFALAGVYRKKAHKNSDSEGGIGPTNSGIKNN